MREPQSSKHVIFLSKDEWMLMGLIASPFQLIDKSTVLVEQCVHIYSFYFIRLTVAVTPHRNCAIAIFPTEIAHLVPPNEITQQLHTSASNSDFVPHRVNHRLDSLSASSHCILWAPIPIRNHSKRSDSGFYGP